MNRKELYLATRDRLDTLIASCNMKQPRDGVYGAILGQAIGDALGSQTEFWHTKTVAELAPTWGYDFPAFSDDTQMMLAITQTILDVPRYASADVFMDRLNENFLAFAKGMWGANNRSPGGTCMSAIHAMLRSGWRSSGIKDGKGNGSAMRSSVIGAAYWNDPSYAFDLGYLSSVNTHNDKEAALAAGGVAFLVARGIQGEPFALGIADLIDHMVAGPLSFPELKDIVTTGSVTFAIKHLSMAYAYGIGKLDKAEFKSFNGNDGKGLEALAAAVFFNVRNCRYSDVIRDCANLTGDSDSTAAIAGAIAGARWGINMIPARWRRVVEKSDMLHNYAEGIWKFSCDAHIEEDKEVQQNQGAD